MKRQLISAVLLCTCVSLCYGQPSGIGGESGKSAGYHPAIVVGTYNIQYDNLKDTENSWADRVVILEKILAEIDFDIFGAQEPYKSQIADMMEYLGDTYAVYGKDRTGGTTGAREHYNPIFYKKDRFTILDDGVFWLSETPETPGSKGWDAYSIRMCNWVKFKDLHTGKEFYHFNCHFDHIGEAARLGSAELVIRRIKSIAGAAPVFLTGDFNSNQNSEVYKKIAHSDIIADSYACALDKKNSDWYTYNGYTYRNAPNSNNRIDHVFVTTAGTCVTQWEIVNTAYGQKYPSDHFPIAIRWQFEK